MKLLSLPPQAVSPRRVIPPLRGAQIGTVGPASVMSLHRPDSRRVTCAGLGARSENVGLILPKTPPVALWREPRRQCSDYEILAVACRAIRLRNWACQNGTCWLNRPGEGVRPDSARQNSKASIEIRVAPSPADPCAAGGAGVHSTIEYWPRMQGKKSLLVRGGMSRGPRNNFSGTSVAYPEVALCCRLMRSRYSNEELMDSSAEPSDFDAEAFARLAEELHAAGDVQETAEQVTAMALNVLGADLASITMIRRGQRLETIAPTDPVAEALDRLQYDLHEGPCYDASWRGETLLSRDLPRDQRWPQWAAKAAAEGICSMLAVELVTAEDRVGALNLYFTTTRDFDQDDVAFANIFGRHASIAVSYKSENAGLLVALDSRKLIGQAQGILMERYDMSESQAFSILTRYSQDNNIRLRDVAEHLRATRKLPKGNQD